MAPILCFSLSAVFLLAWWRWRPRRSARSAAAERALDAFARQHGFARVDGHGDELELLGHRVHGLAGEPFGRLPGVAPLEGGPQRIDLVLHRQSPLGRELLVASYREYGNGWDVGRALVARTLDDPPAGFTIDDDRLTEGTLPSGFDTRLLTGLPRGSRLRVAGGWVLLSIRGDLDPGVACRLMARLAELAGQLGQWRQRHPSCAPHLSLVRW